MTAIASPETTSNFSKYDPYVEKMRSLFAPSLEPRIRGCLENFVYRKDAELLCNYPCLKRCLEMASRLCTPVDAFCRRWDDEGYPENIISHGIKYLIKDGLVDCLINSIILNNRLNKVCRDLDELGVERDLLRSFALWNYINGRDYWVENESTITKSVSQYSCDITDRHSDLEVEIGSDLRDPRNSQALKKSSDDLLGDRNLSVNTNENNRSWPSLENWLIRDSTVPEESKTMDAKRRIISRDYLCKSSNCPARGRQNSRPNDWEGIFLKLKLSEAYRPISTGARSVKLWKLRLPCGSEDLISILTSKFDHRMITTSRKKKFRASVNNVCHRINAALKSLRKNEIGRCRLYCELFPNRLTFKMTRREHNGCKTCLLTDRVLTTTMDNRSRGSSFSQLSQIVENENSGHSGLAIRGSVEPDPKNSRVNDDQDFPEDLRKDSLMASNNDGLPGQFCFCDELSFHVPRNIDPPEKESEPEDLKISPPINNVENSRLEDTECPCNRLDDPEPEENPKESSLLLTADRFADPVCLCSLSVEKLSQRSSQEIKRDIVGVKDEGDSRGSPENRSAPGEQNSGSGSTLNNQNLEDHRDESFSESITKRNIINDKVPAESPQEQSNEINHRAEDLCECLSNCICETKKSSEDEILDCDSQCSCDSCHDEKFKMAVSADPVDSVPLKSVSTKVLSRSTVERAIAKPSGVDRSSQGPENKGDEEKSACRSPPILSARFGRSKGQRINISIELCQESESSVREIVKKDSKDISELDNDGKKMRNIVAEKLISPILRSRCRSEDRDSRKISANQWALRNGGDRCLFERDNREYSPPRASESRDYLPMADRCVPRLRNSIRHEYPIKSGMRKLRDNEAGQYRPPSRNIRSFATDNRGKIRYGNSGTGRRTERVAGSLIGGHLCHAFSSSSIDRMRHLIKTKLRRILLERDKSTNTSKMFLTNKKYRVSVPNEKTEISPFSGQCRTIWESRVPSDSTLTPVSFTSENRTGIRDREEICHLLYAAERSKTPSSNFETTSRISDSKKPAEFFDNRRNTKKRRTMESSGEDSRKRCSRLAGGSDFVPVQKYPAEKQFVLEKKGSSRSERRDRSKYVLKNEKKIDHVVHQNFGHNFDDEARPSIGKTSLSSEKMCRQEFVARSEKFDAPRDPRQIYLRGIISSSHGSTIITPQMCKNNLHPKKLGPGKKIHGKKNNDTFSKRSACVPIFYDVTADKNVRNNCSFETFTMNRPPKAFNYLDRDLRSKLTEYVSLCKNVKYSLLKRLRLNRDEVSRTSIFSENG